MNSIESFHEIYHEKQVKELCALHALNNLFQTRNFFTKVDLDEICHSLSPDVWINPHKSVLGLGNYDINVIMKALEVKGYEAKWYDRRKDPSCLNYDNIIGFILNIPTEFKLGLMTLPIHRRHWIAIRRVQDIFYNLDSKLDKPQVIGTDSELNNFIKEQLKKSDNQLFVIVTSKIGEEQTWIY